MQQRGTEQLRTRDAAYLLLIHDTRAESVYILTSVIVYRRVRTTVDTSGHPHITLNLSHFRSHISAHALPDGRLSKRHRSHHRRAMCETTHSLRGPAVPRPRASDPKRVWKPLRCRSVQAYVQAYARHLKLNSAVGSQPLKSSSSCSRSPPPAVSRHPPVKSRAYSS